MKNNVYADCFFNTSNVDAKAKTIPVILSDESKVLRYNWEDGAYDLI